MREVLFFTVKSQRLAQKLSLKDPAMINDPNSPQKPLGLPSSPLYPLGNVKHKFFFFAKNLAQKLTLRNAQCDF